MARRGANRPEGLLQPRRAMKWLRGFAAASIVGCLISVGRPFAAAGFPTGHDAPAHLTYTYLFDRAIAQGQFPVRWTEWVRSGHGQPLFNFYQPGIYYIVEAIHETTGAGLSNSLKLSVLLSWWTGGLLTFLLLRRFGRWPAALAAVLFVFSPYSMLDVFVRSAYPELASLSFAPGVLWSNRSPAERRSGGARVHRVSFRVPHARVPSPDIPHLCSVVRRLYPVRDLVPRLGTGGTSTHRSSCHLDRDSRRTRRRHGCLLRFPCAVGAEVDPPDRPDDRLFRYPASLRRPRSVGEVGMGLRQFGGWP